MKDENSKIQKVKMMTLTPFRFFRASLVVLISLLFFSTSDVGAQEKSDASLTGTWQSAAVLPDGTTLNADFLLAGDDTTLTGKISDEAGEITLDSANLKDRKLEMKFDFDVEGESRPIVISADWKAPNLLQGEWTVKGANGEDWASGQWSATRQPETIVLFEGKTLDQFRGYDKEEIGAGWKVEDGTLHFDGTKGSGDIVTKQEFKNFVLKFEWKISEGGNSGVMYRVSLGDKKPYLSGPEYQVLDDSKHHDGKKPSTSAGSLYALYVPQNKTLNPVGQWNTSKIVLNGSKVEHWLNGNKVVDAEIGSADWKEKVEASKFKTWEKFGKNDKGHLCFQDHGNKVWYRSITVDVLSD